ncbi:MAG: nucleotide exchange factor GrpE [Bacteroidales bacterium]|nr:nucleotide exchange factor GrpE [Bacteroidales bacterium]
MSDKEKETAEQEVSAENTDIKADQETQNDETQKSNNTSEKIEDSEEKSASKPKKKRGLGFNSKEKELKEEIEELKTKNDELNDKYLRLYSEFDNYRKRTVKEKSELFKTAAEDTILAILPVVDDFERALKTFKTDEAENAHKAGIELIYNKLTSILKNKGVEAIDQSAVDFDLDIHEAITKIPAPTEELKGKVVDVVEKGYKLGGKIIRFAKVVIGE